MNFIRAIFEKKPDGDIHKQFKRFGKGTFENRAAAELTIGKQLKIKTTFEYAGWFAKVLAETIEGSCHITGGIITTKELKGVEFVKIKQFAGVKTYLLDSEVKKENLVNLINDFTDAVFCLSFSTKYGALKTKVKSPKSAKPGKDKDSLKVDYCTFTTSDLSFAKEFAFDVNTNFKSLKISHAFIIRELAVPDEYRNNLDMARIYAKRKGKIIRKINADGKESVKETEFEG